VRDVQL